MQHKKIQRKSESRKMPWKLDYKLIQINQRSRCGRTARRINFTLNIEDYI